MIQALRYEPQGQRFDRQEQQEQSRHIHLHLTLRVRQGRSTPSNAIRLRRIIVALLVATVMPLWIFLWAVLITKGPPVTLLENLVWISSCLSVVAGLALAWCSVGALLRDVWRASPRGRLGLALPLLLLLLISVVTVCFWFGTHGAIPSHLIRLSMIPFFAVLIAHPLITALLFMWVTHEVRALGEIAPTHSKLGFVVVAGMGLMLLGGLFFNLFALLGSGRWQLISLPAICLAVIVAIYALFGSHKSMKAHPKDASPSDLDWPGQL